MSDPAGPDADVLEELRRLTGRIAHLEAEVAKVRAHQSQQGVPDSVVLAISAAVAAFLGHRAKVKQIHYRTGQAYAQQGRVVVQGHHNIHNRAR